MTDRAILHIPWGRQAFQKAVLQPGTPLTIGPSEHAGMPILHDKHVTTQVEVLWDGAAARLRVENTGEPILINGQPATTGQLGHSEWFRIGDTTFMLHREQHTPPTRPGRPLKAASLIQVREALQGAGEHLYAVLDAACDERILQLLREAPDQTQSLYEGVKGDAMAEVAPYLVKLAHRGWLLEALIQEGWGQNWGIYFDSLCPFKEMRRHFRRFLRVQEEDSEEFLYFRFYDPRVLRVFLPTCNKEQLEQLYGPIRCFWVEDSADAIRAFPHRLDAG